MALVLRGLSNVKLARSPETTDWLFLVTDAGLSSYDATLPLMLKEDPELVSLAAMHISDARSTERASVLQ